MTHGPWALFTSKSFRHHGLLALLVAVAFLPVLRGGFLNWDDPSHVYENQAVLAFDVKGMFTQTVNGDMYIPLTSLSFAVEKALFGPDPFVFHRDNLLLHIAVVCLVMGFFTRLGAPPRAAFLGALLFAIHPMRVESVAWVTERKDVLYALFYVLALRQWLAFLEAGKRSDLVVTLLWGALSLLAKPMAVTLPLVLLFMEWWRNGRIGRWMAYVPVTAVTAGIGALTLGHLTRMPGGSYPDPLVWIWSLGFYVWKPFLPALLAPIYEAPAPHVAGIVYGASGVVVGLLVWAVARVAGRQRDRWLLWAAGFFFLSIFPVLRWDVYYRNIVADRFMYLPVTGLCLWLGIKADLAVARYGYLARVVLAGVCVFLGVLTYSYSLSWHDSLTFWDRVISACPPPPAGHEVQPVMRPTDGLARGNAEDMYGASTLVLALFNRGLHYKDLARAKLDQGATPEAWALYRQAMADFDEALRLEPWAAAVHNSRALVRHYFGDEAGALDDLSIAVAHDPSYQQAFINRCGQYGVMGRMDQALADCRRAVTLGASSPELYSNLGLVYAHQGMFKESLASFDKALALDPRNAAAVSNRAAVVDAMQDAGPELKQP